MGNAQVDTLRDALRNYAEAKNRHDVDAVVAAYTPDGSYRDSGVGRPISGQGQLRAFYQAVFRSIPDYHGQFDGVAFAENTAVVWGRMTGTVSDDLLGLPATAGNHIDIPVTFVCTFHDGQLASDTGYFDTQLLYQQAGVPATEPDILTFVAGWEQFWAAPGDATGVHDLVTDDVALYWPGATEPLRGRDAYAGRLAAAVQLIPDLTLSVVQFAHRDGHLMLAWEGRGTIGGELRQWPGVDRFRLRGNRTAETTVVFDTRSVLPTVPSTS
ncbi:nuclear transport factor 2 family protein [Mycolicibacterium fortuitum]|uniref:nuclear transport factor 2 family protein n=1 Tax=Mycolicibacterium fortuitum TaxID=1766 RepID=UPI001130FC36|nr:nuclear transport factor 2 family protein [Mycolicibacterium fortuitum]TPW91858.1 nuclear transport factor 2 family protein [Mycolicibacterium fortuitum]UBV22817.1 nuclear transport factor 2 family protein [Mycolicibacterium fortuitum]UHJ53992.1 nuclear transport factor 2 family protein [Mycolicibacterium fortuitum]